MADTLGSKALQPADKVVESLLRLRDELYKRPDDAIANEIFFKINSCLYGEYPHRKETE